MIEHIKHLREPGFGARASCCRMPDPKMLANGFGVGQFAHRTIYGNQSKSLPDLALKVIIEVADLCLVQFNESFVFELPTSLGEGQGCSVLKFSAGAGWRPWNPGQSNKFEAGLQNPPAWIGIVNRRRSVSRGSIDFNRLAV